jgi:hypothetical protein
VKKKNESHFDNQVSERINLKILEQMENFRMVRSTASRRRTLTSSE